MEYNSAIKRNEIVKHATWMDLKTYYVKEASHRRPIMYDSICIKCPE